MITNRTMPSSVNVFQVTVRRGSADGSLQGCVKSHSLGLQAQFSSLSRMVILIEEWLDFAVPLPHPQPRKSTPAPLAGLPCRPLQAKGMACVK